MSGALHSWYSLPDIRALAERGARLEGELDLAKLGRLKDFLSSSEGQAKASLEFRLLGGDLLVITLRCTATLELTCQRCLQPVAHELSECVEFAVADEARSLPALPEGMELIALEGDRLQPATLIEDELIVSLPLVPKHGDE